MDPKLPGFTKPWKWHLKDDPKLKVPEPLPLIKFKRDLIAGVLAMNEQNASVQANSDAAGSDASLASSNRSRNAKSKYAEIQIGNGLEMAQRVCMHMLIAYRRLEDECAAASDVDDGSGGRNTGQLPQHLFFAAASEFNTGQIM
jgi:hypothetical protein